MAYIPPHKRHSMDSKKPSPIPQVAYIPPHKRHSKDSEKPSPIPQVAYIPPHKRHSIDSKKPSPIPQVTVKQSPVCQKFGRIWNIFYADDAIFRWFISGFDADNNQFPYSLHLKEASEHEMVRGKPQFLLNKFPAREKDEEGETISGSPSESVAVNVWPDLLSSFEIVKNKMVTKDLDEGKLTMVAEFGDFLFRGSPSVSSESVRKDQVTEATLRQMYRRFGSHTCPSYMENFINDVVPKIGVVLEEEKDTYYIKLSHSTKPESDVLCKCRLTEDKKLELYKVEPNRLFHTFINISCIDKNLDLRLRLRTKMISTVLTDDEMHNIRNIINSAIIDSEVEGGLRWPLGKASSGDQYTVIIVRHTITKNYRGSSFRLETGYEDIYDLENTIGYLGSDVSLKLKSIVSCLQEEKVETDSVFDIFKDNLRMIWDHFLCCEACDKEYCA